MRGRGTRLAGLLLLSVLPGLAVAAPVGMNIFPAGLLNFTSFRGVVMVRAGSVALTFSTGRIHGGDNGARAVVMRRSVDLLASGAGGGTWEDAVVVGVCVHMRYRTHFTMVRLWPRPSVLLRMRLRRVLRPQHNRCPV